MDQLFWITNLIQHIQIIKITAAIICDTKNYLIILTKASDYKRQRCYDIRHEQFIINKSYITTKIVLLFSTNNLLLHHSQTNLPKLLLCKHTLYSKGNQGKGRNNLL